MPRSLLPRGSQLRSFAEEIGDEDEGDDEQAKRDRVANAVKQTTADAVALMTSLHADNTSGENGEKNHHDNEMELISDHFLGGLGWKANL